MMRRFLFFLFSLIIVLFLSGIAFADDTVRLIEFIGNKKTKSHRILAYFETKIGRPFDPIVFDHDIAELKSWYYFEYVRPRIERRDDGVYIRIELKEKWTVLPEVSFDYAGGVYALRLGVRDNNLFGLHQTAVIYGGYRSGDWLAGVRFTEPRIAGSRFGMHAVASRDFYEDPYYVDYRSVHPQYVPVADRLGGQLRFDYLFHRWFKAGVLGKYSFDRIKTGENSQTENPPKSLDFEIPQTSVVAGVGPYIYAGSVTVDQYIYRGVGFEGYALYHDSALGSRSDFWRFSGDLRGYLPIPYQMNAAGRLYAGYENSDQYIEQFALGSLDSLRGYPDRRFRAKGAAFANFEYRWMAGSWWWFSWMFAGFFDAGYLWNDSTKALAVPDTLHLGAGPGLRWIFNRWDYAMIRADVAWPIGIRRPTQFSIGMNMYF